jgi:hypothetical protein
MASIKTVVKKSIIKPIKKVVLESDDNDSNVESNDEFQDCNQVEKQIEKQVEKQVDGNSETIDYQANKFILCVLKTQVGKTFTAIARINNELEQDPELGKSIHIVFTMNTLLNGKQFSKRLESIENKYGKGSVAILASKYTGDYKHVSKREELQGLILNKKTCPRVVVMCSNNTRYTDGVEVMQVLENNKTSIQRAFIYYDELHQYINKEVRKQIEEIHGLNITTGIYALTATPDKIWQASGFWSLLKLHYFDDYNDENYIGFTDMNFQNIDNYFSLPYIKPHPFDYNLKAFQAVGFAQHVLEQHPTILAKGTRVFIPGHLKRSSHLEIRDLAFATNWKSVVIVLNGEIKKLYFKTNEKDTVDAINIVCEDEELSNVVYNILEARKLLGRPIVYTGFICIGMGQTLVNEKIGNFTAAILGHLDLNNDEIYQLFGRITGRMRHWQSYTQTKVYCPSITKHRCNVMEFCSRAISNDHNGEVVSRDDYLNPIDKMGEAGKITSTYIRKDNKPVKGISNKDKMNAKLKELQYKLFDNQTDAIEYAKKEFNKTIYLRKDTTPPKDASDKDGKNLTSELLIEKLGKLIMPKVPIRLISVNDTINTSKGTQKTIKWMLIWKLSINNPSDTTQNTNATNATTEAVDSDATTEAVDSDAASDAEMDSSVDDILEDVSDSNDSMDDTVDE